jgi:LysR family transcriptional regulator, benzoate and cis,cis-muconate-responsive activator of ben and cat genes
MLEQIRSFLTVVEEGSLCRAAARLHISQSTLSRQMQVLELELGGRLLERMATGVRLTAGGQALAERMGALLASYDLAIGATRRALHGETDQVRIAYLLTAKQYLNGPLREIRRSHPETVLKLVNLSPGKQIAALRAGEIDIGLTNESGELLAGEFYTRKLADMGSYVALPEQHRLASRDRVQLSDLKGEFFAGWDSQEVPGMDRRVEAYCKKYGKFRPKFHGSAQTLAQLAELIANEKAVFILPAHASHHSPPGVVILPLADAEVTWKILVIWRRGRAGGALKALLDALFTKEAPKANETTVLGAQAKP